MIVFILCIDTIRIPVLKPAAPCRLFVVSVHTTTFDIPNFSRSLSSIGLSILVSAVLLGLTEKANLYFVLKIRL